MKHGSRRVPPKKETAALLGVCYDVVEVLVASLACIVLLFTFLFRVVGVEGDSMMDTLYGGDRLILCPALSSPDRGDIVVINRYTDEPLVKRVIGWQAIRSKSTRSSTRSGSTGNFSTSPMCSTRPRPMT